MSHLRIYRRSHLVLTAAALSLTACVSAPANAAATTTSSDAIQRHEFHAGERFTYEYDDTDIDFCGSAKSGIPVASQPQNMQQIKIPVDIAIKSDGKILTRDLTMLSQAQYREGTAAKIAEVKFTQISTLIKAMPTPFTYSYTDEGTVLSHLFSTFQDLFKNPNFVSDPTTQFLFFKMQDVHQMQMSAFSVPTGMKPGDSYITPAHETPGLGGKFTSGSSHYIYVATEKMDGVRVAQIRATDLGNEFSNESFKVYTNFTFTMYIALEGPKQGLLVLGTGQETAFPVSATPNDQCGQTILQRQFSIRLK